MARKPKKKGVHYVDNKKFLEAMKDWKEECREAEEMGEEKPRVSNYIGECFLKIANGLSFRPNFINYTYRDEMISDGIENCIQYIKISIQKNQIILLHILLKLSIMLLFVGYKRRKKQTHVKHRMIEKQEFIPWVTNPHDDRQYQVSGFDINVMVPDEAVYKPKKKETKNKISGLEEFMELDD